MKKSKFYSRALLMSFFLGGTIATKICSENQIEITPEIKTSVDLQIVELFNNLIYNASDNIPFNAYADQALALLRQYKQMFLEILERNGISNSAAYLEERIESLEQIKFTNSYSDIVNELQKWAALAPEKTAQFIKDQTTIKKKVQARIGLQRRMNIPNVPLNTMA